MRSMLVFFAALAVGPLAASGAVAAPIPYAPTASDAVPVAILGNGTAPQGAAVAYLTGDPKTVGYLAEPMGPGPHGAVILIHEWDGLVDRVKQVADALAAEGYVAFAADLYSGRTGRNPDENMALVKETLADMPRVVKNLDAAVAYLKKREDISGKIAAIGWCFGGGIALSFALDGVNHEGTAMFYGRLLDDPEQMKKLHHEIYGTFAGLDPSIPKDQVERFATALKAAGVANDIHVYDAVQHGFWLYVDRDPEHNSGPALDAWQRLKAYLKRTLL